MVISGIVFLSPMNGDYNQIWPRNPRSLALWIPGFSESNVTA